MVARSIAGAVSVLSSEILPNGVGVLTAPCHSQTNFAAMPAAVRFGRDGDCYGLSGWNSDRGVAYYRTDKAHADTIAMVR